MLAEVTFAAPSQRLISTVTGRDVTSESDLRDLLCSQLVSPVRLAEALAEAEGSADLLLDTGPGQAMAALTAGCSEVPAVSLAADPAGTGGLADTGGPDSPATRATRASGTSPGARPIPKPGTVQPARATRAA